MSEQVKLEYDFNLHSTAVMEYAKELTTKGERLRFENEVTISAMTFRTHAGPKVDA
jgi:hypothetical protein